MIKKKFLIAVIFTAVLVFVSMNAAASDYFDAEDFDIVGGISYNYFDLTKTTDGSSAADEDSDILENGFGFFLGGRYWIKEDLALGLGYDKAGSSATDSSDVKKSLDIKGPYAEIVYSLNDNVNFSAAAVSYSFEKAERNEDLKIKQLEGQGLGFIIGGEYCYTVNENFSINGIASYRLAELNVSEEYGFEVENTSFDMSGLRASCGFNYSF